jgi:hypothetical protein
VSAEAAHKMSTDELIACTVAKEEITSCLATVMCARSVTCGVKPVATARAGQRIALWQGSVRMWSRANVVARQIKN